ncbi:hypothetical protein QE152_g15887 [Popillia japonica]|uniref:Uncharacterized protein n=1 Tax=Popillia japonica TaxID=7064 RepID=A0AAW1L7L1_POPJA
MPEEQKIIVACIVLHNVAKSLQDLDFEAPEEMPEEDGNDNDEVDLPLRQQGQEVTYYLFLEDILASIRKFKRIIFPFCPKNFTKQDLEEFLNKYTPDLVPSKFNLSFNYPIKKIEVLDQPFTMDELNSVLRLKKDTSPGYDEIKHSMVSHLPLCAKLYLLTCFNNILEGQSVPVEWRRVLICPIPKA